MKKKIIILACLITFSITGVAAASIINSKEIKFNNSKSNLKSTNVQDALDELNEKNKLKNRNNIVEAYKYNQTTGASDYCVTGDEETCVETTCYTNATAGSCPSGTIIVYKVNENETERFHVMYDNGTTLTMQSQRNTIYNTQWIDAADYASENTDGTTCGYESCNDEGPITILNALESATAGWTNVNTQKYTMGTTIFKTNSFTGCSTYSSCTVNTYTLPERSAKARMITAQEASNLGCTFNESLCPIWMYNYLENSITYGGTINDTNALNSENNNGYWIMNSHSSYPYLAWRIFYDGLVSNYQISSIPNGARAVVEINK